MLAVSVVELLLHVAFGLDMYCRSFSRDIFHGWAGVARDKSMKYLLLLVVQIVIGILYIDGKFLCVNVKFLFCLFNFSSHQKNNYFYGKKFPSMVDFECQLNHDIRSMNCSGNTMCSYKI